MSDALTPAELRQRLAARMAELCPGVLAVESEEPYPTVRSGSHSPVHREFAIGMLSTTPLVSAGGRQRPEDGQHVEEEVRVGFWHQLEPANKVADFDTLLAAEAATRNHLIARGTWRHGFTSTWTRTTRDAGPDGWLWVEHHLTISYTLALT